MNALVPSLLASALVGLPNVAAAQTATLAGSVYLRTGARDSVAGANVNVVLPELGREAVADAQGRFRLGQLPVGRYRVVVRATHVAPVQDTVELRADEVVTRSFTVLPHGVVLAPVEVTGEAGPLSSRMRAFEERRARGHGRFITEDYLREHDGRSIASVVLDRVPGVRAVHDGSATYLASNRTVAEQPGPVFQKKPRAQRASQPRAAACWLTVYIDGVRMLDDGMEGRPPFDLARLGAREYAAIEYYPSGATAPIEYRATGGGCGTLLLWTRER